MAKLREKILIVDGDIKYCMTLKERLEAEGYSVLYANRGRDALEIIASHCPDLVLLETSLPDIDGNILIKSVRGWSRLPIIVLSQRVNENDKVRSLDLGCDDYMTKPVGIVELFARIRAAFRHTLTAENSARLAVERCYAVRGLKIDYLKHKVYLFGRDVKLTPIEYRIVSILGKRAGQVLSYRQIIHELWGPSASTDNKILRVHMANIRRKIEKDCDNPIYISTEVGVGYMLIDEN